jgi:phage terminase small subunit
MAGVKGRSGGARPGAGRKAKAKPEQPLLPPAPPAADTPLAFLKGVMNDLEQDPRLRVRAAIAAAQYEHMKKGDGGKKDETAEKAKQAAGGKFKSAPPPLKLVAPRG